MPHFPYMIVLYQILPKNTRQSARTKAFAEMYNGTNYGKYLYYHNIEAQCKFNFVKIHLDKLAKA